MSYRPIPVCVLLTLAACDAPDVDARSLELATWTELSSSGDTEPDITTSGTTPSSGDDTGDDTCDTTTDGSFTVDTTVYVGLMGTGNSCAQAREDALNSPGGQAAQALSTQCLNAGGMYTWTYNTGKGFGLSIPSFPGCAVGSDFYFYNLHSVTVSCTYPASVIY